MRIRLTCTSFLPDRSPAWRQLAGHAELDVGGYGDWPAALCGDYGDLTLVWVVFLDDLLPWDAFLKDETRATELLNEAIAGALSALDRRLEAARAPTLVAWLGWAPDTPIRSARRLRLREMAAARLSAELYDRAAKYSGLYMISLDALFAQEGMRHCLDSRNFYASRCRLSLTGLKVLAQGIDSILGRIERAASKVLVLDCDNTLWGGVVGELGVGGIALGQDGIGNAYVAFQRIAKTLASHGTLLAISSKNETSDVRNVFGQHPSMVLRWEDITAYRIDWREKSIHLREIAADLDIGLDSLVFWDDNPLEREKIRAELPKVCVPEPPKEVADWPEALASLDSLASLTTTADDWHKTQQYRARAAFVSEARTAANAEAFLAGIGMQPRLVEIDAATLSRAAQLCAKTNQFNLRLARHDAAAIETMLQKRSGIGFLVGLKDKFGDHGIIGLALAVPTQQTDVAFLDTFLMSCRVLGRHLEAWMLAQLQRRLRLAGYRHLVAQFVPGERNSPAAGFLPAHGFIRVSEASALSTPIAEIIPAFDGDRHDEPYIANIERWTIPHLELFPNAPAQS